MITKKTATEDDYDSPSGKALSQIDVTTSEGAIVMVQVSKATAAEDIPTHNLVVHCAFEGSAAEESTCCSLGVMTDDDGNAITNGCQAQRAKADGREPTIGDIKMVTKNSFMSTADKAKVHVDKSDNIKTIGTDDGEETTISDPGTKEGTNKGSPGNPDSLHGIYECHVE